ncbi:MAG TPA: hypothetical protein VNF47_07195 [Streptosporangiaceae bacterium]|nr:hypothetical protein [Streptosporangiaceae bacterium]
MSSGTEAGRRVTRLELLGIREDSWRRRLRNASLVAEADISSQLTEQVISVLGYFYFSKRQDESFLRRWPACLAAGMAGVAATRFQAGTYWPALWDTAGFQGSTQDQGVWGRAFNEAVDRLGMATFPQLPLHFVGPILMHAGIPTYCLGDYFRLLLHRRRRDPGMDAESFMAWATAPGRDLRLSELDVPARRFLTDGADYALDVVDRCLDLLERLEYPDPDLDGILLPVRIIEAGREAAREHDLERGGPRTGSRRLASGAKPRPRISLDPYGVGVQVVLPAVGDAPDGIATWRVVADGDTATVRSRAQWLGSAEAAPETAHPLPRPVRIVHVSLLGWDHVSELRVIEPADPVLFFADDGRRLPGILPLPPDHVWILHPADRELAVTGDLRVLVESPAPFGWEGWQLRLASLENVRSLGLAGRPSHPVQGYVRPRLLLGAPVPGLTTPYGSPVYPDPPRLWLPGTSESAIAWHVDVRRTANGSPVMSRLFDTPGEANIWDKVSRPILGAFDVTVRGPLGRGMRRAIFIAEHVTAAYQPAVRALRADGLEPASADLRIPEGASANPARLGFARSERGHVTELRAGVETEPVVVTPPHVDVLCAGAGAGTWTAAPVNAATEAMAGIGRLLIRAPGISVTADLEVWVGPRRVQAIPPSGQPSAGLVGYHLARAVETVAHHGRAELVLPWGRGTMPVAFIRPRRLATGAHVEAGQLRIRDCVPVDGLVAGLYMACAPWRPPVVVPVPGDGQPQLPPGLSESGPILVLLRIEDPWTVTDWPAWPARDAYLCDLPGSPASDDAEEAAVSRYLAGEGELPATLRHLERIWLLVHLADDLIRAGAPASVRARCSALLREQPGAALIALLDAGLDAGTSVACLISSGLGVAQPAAPAETLAAGRLWDAIPGAAAVLTGRILAGPASPGSADVLDAAAAQCGENLATLLGGDDDPCAQVGQFGPDAERMALLTAEQLEAVWQAAAVVPHALLDADTRAVAARRMFDARRTPELAGAARDATSVVRSAERLVSSSEYPGMVSQITARRHPDRRGGWLALPAMSAALALAARIAARGDEQFQAFERAWRERWADLARRAPDLVQIDLVLAEALIAGAQLASVAEVQHDITF